MTQTKPLWGPETTKALANFQISGEPVPASVIRWLARIKGVAAMVNAELGLLQPDMAARINAAAEAVASGQHAEAFPVDVFQTGSGTSTNMNVNEVLATLAGVDVHPNDHVNLGQSSNDTFPSAVHLAALHTALTETLPALKELQTALEGRADAFSTIVKTGRTHLMDAVPVTLGDEFAGYAMQMAQGQARLRDSLPRLAEIPLGGTAVGTGLNSDPRFASAARERLSAMLEYPVQRPAHPFEAQGARDALVECSGALKVIAVSLSKIANDIRWMGSGPRAGLAEILLPELQKGSSIMPGKVNPVLSEVVQQVAAQVIGNDAAITVAGMGGNFELNVMIPLMARNLLQSLILLARASEVFATRCVSGIEANSTRCMHYAESNLQIATALNPIIGYDRATAIVKSAVASGRSIRDVALEQGVEAAILDQALDLVRIARGHLDREGY